MKKIVLSFDDYVFKIYENENENKNKIVEDNISFNSFKNNSKIQNILNNVIHSLRMYNYKDDDLDYRIKEIFKYLNKKDINSIKEINTQVKNIEIKNIIGSFYNSEFKIGSIRFLNDFIAKINSINISQKVEILKKLFNNSTSGIEISSHIIKKINSNTSFLPGSGLDKQLFLTPNKKMYSLDIENYKDKINDIIKKYFLDNNNNFYQIENLNKEKNYFNYVILQYYINNIKSVNIKNVDENYLKEFNKINLGIKKYDEKTNTFNIKINNNSNIFKNDDLQEFIKINIKSIISGYFGRINKITFIINGEKINDKRKLNIKNFFETLLSYKINDENFSIERTNENNKNMKLIIDGIKLNVDEKKDYEFNINENEYILNNFDITQIFLVFKTRSTVLPIIS